MSANEELVPKANTKSAVWEYFGFIPDKEGKPKDEDKPVCKLCKKTVLSKGSNTSNLFTHLRTTHPKIHTQLKTAKPLSTTTSSKQKEPAERTTMTIAESLMRAEPYPRSSKKWKQLTDSVAFCLAKDSMPLYTVSKPGFKKMIDTFDHRYELPSRKYFSRTAIPKMYEETREKVASDLQGMEYFSATADLWSSGTMEPYLSFTVHFISNDWEMHSRCLQTLFCPSDHTAINLAEALKDTLDKWNLREDQLSCLTTDNGTNIVKAAKDMNWPRLACFGHNLHLAVTNATKDDSRVLRALGLCRKLVGSFSHSWKKQRNLSKAQVELGLPQHSLITDCVTRWGSQQKMVRRILEQENAIRQVLVADRKTAHLIPKWQDVEVLESLDKVLTPLADFTNVMSVERYVTVSSLRPLLHHLETEILVEQEGETDTTLTADIKERVCISLKSRYADENVSELIDKAAFLDPRFRLDYVADEDVPHIKDCIARETTKILEVLENQQSTESSSTCTRTPDAPPPAKKKRLGSLFKKKETTDDQTLSPEQKAKKEIERYLHSPQPDTESNPLSWWKLQAPHYPGLSKIAQKYLCICATSEASERLFSVAGNVVTAKRSCLKPDKVNMLTFLANNL